MNLKFSKEDKYQAKRMASICVVNSGARWVHIKIKYTYFSFFIIESFLYNVSIKYMYKSMQVVINLLNLNSCFYITYECTAAPFIQLPLAL